MALKNTPKLPQKIWASILLIMLVIVPAVLYIQLTIESASEKELQAIANLSGTKLSGNNTPPPKEDKIIIKEITKEITKEVVVEDFVEDNIIDCIAKKGEKQCWRELKRKAWLAALDKLEKLPESNVTKYTSNDSWQTFDLITPTHQCDLNYFSREGMTGDGGKWICGPLTTDDNCVIFSLGSNGQFDFEQSMQNYTKGKCKIHTFDCTGKWEDPSTTFHPWCIAGKDYTDESNGRVYKRLSTIFKELDIKEINYLKMDIEGYEWKVFEDILKPENAFALPRQISFELHVYYPEAQLDKSEFKYTKNWLHPTIKLLKLIDSAGYRFATTERNTLCPGCAEFVIVREYVQ